MRKKKQNPLEKKRVLFILKQRDLKSGVDEYSEVPYSSEYSDQGLTTGLLNSALHVSHMLDECRGISSKVVIVPDNNAIDREVSLYKPDYVIIEALWVVPSKFDVLTRFHPKVEWIVRLHSEIPFIANESVAFEWIGQYIQYKNVSVAVNSYRFEAELEFYFRNILNVKNAKKKIIYLPNYYPDEFRDFVIDKTKDTVDVSCFGAIRPLKNHLIQAFAAIMFAKKIGKKLNFHINVARVEQNGGAILRNLESLFDSFSDKGFNLIKHNWYERNIFLEVCGKMDIGMQVSLSETFNLVTADLISQGIPVVTSSEIKWVDKSSQADPTDSRDIAKTLEAVYRNPKKNANLNKSYLRSFSERSKEIWIYYINEYYAEND